jgi:arginyl-tRNA synthetase
MHFNTPLQEIQIAIATAVSQLFNIDLVPNQVSVNIAYPKYAADYTCAIALSLANNNSALTNLGIATAIAQHCLLEQDFANKFEIAAIGKGWLNISLTASYRLETLVNLERWHPEKQNIPNSSDRDDTAYVYARCHGLLRLAEQSRLFPQGLYPHNFDDEPAAIALLLQNLAIADYLQNPPMQTVRMTDKLRRSLVTAFLNFYRQCCIFGVSADLAQTRIYLISITQKLIQAIAPSDISYHPYL